VATLEKKQSIIPIPIIKSPAKDAHLREGSGFSLLEIKSAGYELQPFKNLGIKIDYRRKTAHEKNIEMLKTLKIPEKKQKKREPFVAKEKKRTGFKPKTKKGKKKATPAIKKEKVEIEPSKIKKEKVKAEKPKEKKEKEEIIQAKEAIPLTELQGLGPATAKKLNELGVESVEDLIKENSEELASLVKGCTEERLKKWIEEGKELMTK
jgi:ribosomal protein L13E/predicted flap endonuclease-1-like 5' DNA nuclease